MAMPGRSTPQPAPASFVIERQGHRSQFTYQQVFAIGHQLWLGRKYAQAERVFKTLSGQSDRGPRAHILLARCQAMQGNLAECCGTLSRAMPPARYGTAASDLHDTFVMWKLQLYQEVKSGLETIIAEHPELPTPCLILGDFLMQVGNSVQPPQLLQQAIDRDRPNGAIARIARKELPAALERAAAQAARPKPQVRKRPGS